MTKEDAIYWLEVLKMHSEKRDAQRITDALNMAIDALRKTEPQIDGAIDEARFKAHCMNCQRDVADIKCLDCDGDKYFIPDEPQTDCSWR